MAWFCKNDRYETNSNKGHSHGEGNPKGSVFRDPLSGIVGQDYTLWVEHISQHKDPNWEGFWLMWYSPKGNPTLPGSAVFDAKDLRQLVSRLSDFSTMV